MNSKFLKTIGCLAIALALAACSSEENMADSNELPEGKYPITFTATGLQAMVVSRATADGKWGANDVVAVQLEGGEIKKYTTDVSGESVTLKPLDADNTFYWKNTSDSCNVTAWSFGGYRANPEGITAPTNITVAPGQNENESDYSDCDFIYAHGTLSYTGNKSLTFYHQTAKVVVHVLSGDELKISQMKTRQLSMTGNWVAPTGEDNYGKTTAITTDPDYLKPFWPFPFNAGTVALPENTTGELRNSYKFLVVPQEVTGGSALFTITADGTPYTYTPAAAIEWKAGHEYTYFITIRDSNTTKAVSRSVDDTGSGTAELLLLRESSMDND